MWVSTPSLFFSFFYYLFYFILFYFIFLFVVNFVIHWNETAMGLHVFPILIPPPTSISTHSLQVFPVHQVWALVSCIQPGLVICFTPHHLFSILLPLFFISKYCNTKFWEIRTSPIWYKDIFTPNKIFDHSSVSSNTRANINISPSLWNVFLEILWSNDGQLNFLW